MTPYDWATERDRRGFLDAVAALGCLLAAVVLMPIGVWLLTTGRFAGWVVAALAVALAAMAGMFRANSKAGE